jgi:hypothetical protein
LVKTTEKFNTQFVVVLTNENIGQIL